MVTIGNAASTIGIPNIPGDQQEGVTPGGNTWPAPRTPLGIPGSHPRALGCTNIEGRGTPLDSKNIWNSNGGHVTTSLRAVEYLASRRHT